MDMKNKKRVLIILLILIVVVLIILGIVLIFGGIKNKAINDFENEVTNAACEYVNSEYNSPSLIEAYPHLTKIKYATLINAGYLDPNLTNPLTKERTIENTTDYIEITYTDSQYVCTYKEG